MFIWKCLTVSNESSMNDWYLFSFHWDTMLNGYIKFVLLFCHMLYISSLSLLCWVFSKCVILLNRRVSLTHYHSWPCAIKPSLKIFHFLPLWVFFMGSIGRMPPDSCSANWWPHILVKHRTDTERPQTDVSLTSTWNLGV